MNDKERDLLDDFTNKLVKELPSEQPSSALLNNVMNAVNNIKVKENEVWKPLISTKGWFLIIVSIISSMFMLLKTEPIKSPEFVSKIDASKLSNLFSFDYSLNFTTSNTVIYGFLFFAIMMTIQIVYLKNYHNKQF
ncbi:MAG: hypothetical protein L3J14_01855 [Flavobacteriaceae bacterium]|nr:hypothetical protein [Flavobacteriaceae bacterium]